MCMCYFACKGHPQNDLDCVGCDVKPYSLTPLPHNHNLSPVIITAQRFGMLTLLQIDVSCWATTNSHFEQWRDISCNSLQMH